MGRMGLNKGPYKLGRPGLSLHAVLFCHHFLLLLPPLSPTLLSQLICSSTDHPELKWIAGLYYYMTDVQPTDVDNWNYFYKLKAFVDNGMGAQHNGFIDGVSSIVNRGGPFAGGVHGIQDRRDNFRTVLIGMGLVKS